MDSEHASRDQQVAPDTDAYALSDRAEAEGHQDSTRMVPEELEEYENLWTTEKDKYVLLEDALGELLPVGLGDQYPMALLIEDDAVASEVCRRMREAGVKVVTSLTG